MSWRPFQFSLYIIPILWIFLKDLVWEDLSFGEIRTNYLFGKANAYDRADFLRKAVRVYKEILRKDSNRIAVFLNLGGLYYRRGMFETAIPYYEK
ncbi:MAG: tetratricopeptide repeat protein, partial [Desulfobacterales bacterium]|nr:tetratricopeptide repeat protein [Desulfobacterales bacterium]